MPTEPHDHRIGTAGLEPATPGTQSGQGKSHASPKDPGNAHVTGDPVAAGRAATGPAVRHDVRHFDNGCPDCFGTGVDVYMDRCPTCKGRFTTEHIRDLQYRWMRNALERLDSDAVQHPHRLIRTVMTRVRDLEAGAR